MKHSLRLLGAMAALWFCVVLHAQPFTPDPIEKIPSLLASPNADLELRALQSVALLLNQEKIDRKNEAIFRAVLPKTKSSNEKVRWYAFLILGKMNIENSLSTLLEGLKDKEKTIRALAAEGLGFVVRSDGGKEAAFKALEAAFKTERDYEAIGGIISGFGKLKDPRATPILAAHLGEHKIKAEGIDAYTVYVSALRALTSIGDRKAVDILYATYEDGHTELLQREALKCLGELGEVGILDSALLAVDSNDALWNYAGVAAIRSLYSGSQKTNSSLVERRRDVLARLEALLARTPKPSKEPRKAHVAPETINELKKIVEAQ